MVHCTFSEQPRLSHANGFDFLGTTVIVFTNLTFKDPHRQAGVFRVIAPENLDRLVVRTLALEWPRCGFEQRSRHNVYLVDNTY